MAGVSRPISIWPKLGTRPLVEEEADRWAIARRSRLPAGFTRTLARGPILVAVAPGPDMAVEDAWETSEADGETRSCGGEPGGEGVGTEVPGEAWLPNSHSSSPGEPDKGTCNIWKLWKKK